MPPAGRPCSWGHRCEVEAGKGYIMASQDLLDLLRDLLDRTAAGYRGVEVGEESAHRPAQAYCQELRCGAEHCEGVQRSRRDGDRRTRREIEALILDLNQYPAVENVIGLRPAGAMRWCGRSARRVDLEEFVLIIGVCCVDLHGVDSVGSCELATLARGSVLNQMCHTSDARLAAL